MLKLLVWAIFLSLAALVVTPLLVLYQGVQLAPLVSPAASARQEDIGRIKTLLQRHDPRAMREGETRTLTVSERDLNLGLRSVLPTGKQQTEVSLSRGLAAVSYTLALPENPLGAYFNVSLLIREERGELTLDSLRFGQLDVPAWPLEPLLTLADQRLKSRFEEYRGARAALQGVSLNTAAASFTYRWDGALAKQIEQRGRQVLLPGVDRQRAIAYYQVLVQASHSVGGSTSLERLLQPLFAAARQRSDGGDAVAENRALLLVLGTVMNGSSVARLVGGDPADLGPGHRYIKWTLRGRGDLAQHFGVSAAIAAAGGGVLADSIGVFKELDDSRGGSGFSFPDLLADRAGVELATAATGAQAQHVQQAMASDALRESDFMPSFSRLPEGLMEMEFRRRYRDLDDARYAKVKREIDQRIARVPLHSQANL